MSKPEAFHAYLVIGKDRIPVLETEDYDQMGVTVGVDPRYTLPTGDSFKCMLEAGPCQAEFKAFIGSFGQREFRAGSPNARMLGFYRLTFERDFAPLTAR